MTEPHATAPARLPADTPVPFGDGPAQMLSVLLAEQVLRLVWKKNPMQFGNYVKEAMVKLWAEDTERAASNGNGRAS
jgi:hypothetical protein